MEERVPYFLTSFGLLVDVHGLLGLLLDAILVVLALATVDETLQLLVVILKISQKLLSQRHDELGFVCSDINIQEQELQDAV